MLLDLDELYSKEVEEKEETYDEELVSLIKEVLLLSKHGHGMTYEQVYILYNEIYKRLSGAEKFTYKLGIADKAIMDICYIKRINTFNRLPKEVLDKIEDKENLYLGIVSKETRKILKGYLKELDEKVGSIGTYTPRDWGRKE